MLLETVDTIISREFPTADRNLTQHLFHLLVLAERLKPGTISGESVYEPAKRFQEVTDCYAESLHNRYQNGDRIDGIRLRANHDPVGVTFFWQGQLQNGDIEVGSVTVEELADDSMVLKAIHAIAEHVHALSGVLNAAQFGLTRIALQDCLHPSEGDIEYDNCYDWDDVLVLSAARLRGAR